MGSYGFLACRAYFDTATGTSEDIFYFIAIRGTIRDESMPGIETRSSDSRSSPLPLRHRGPARSEPPSTNLVHTQLEYASTVLDHTNETNINTVEAIQRRAAWFITGDYRKESSVTAMFRNLELESLQERRPQG